MATIYEIAKKAGVSPTTVSKVINNYPDVSDKTRQKIKKILKEERFRPNSQAQFLSTKKTWTLGVVFFENLGIGFNHSFFAGVIEGFKKQADKYGYALLFGTKNERLNNTTYLEYFRYMHVDAIAIVCTDPNSIETKEMINSEFPIVVIDMFNDNTATVTSDNEQGCRLAIKHLYDLGHRKIAHIIGTREDNNWPSDVRKETYKKVMKELNLPILEGYLAEGMNFNIAGGYNAMKKLLALDEIPNSVFAASDRIAFGAIEAIKEEGLRVPEDISIIGFDDIEMCNYLTPKLTTIRQNLDDIGESAVDILVKQIDEKTKYKLKKIVPVELIQRDSCSEFKK